MFKELLIQLMKIHVTFKNYEKYKNMQYDDKRKNDKNKDIISKRIDIIVVIVRHHDNR